jgi:hypothetical protein
MASQKKHELKSKLQSHSMRLMKRRINANIAFSESAYPVPQKLKKILLKNVPTHCIRQ